MADILILSVEKRTKTALNVQKVLTNSGCIIKTRLGIHENVEKCGDKGLIILDVSGKKAEIKALSAKLNKISGVKAKAVSI